MKILWLSGNPALYKRQSMIDGGWIGALQKEIIKNDVNLSIAFPYDENESPSGNDKVRYYPMYINKWKKKFLNSFPHILDDCFLNKIKCIVEDCQPDVIHCWGSELPFGLIAQYTDIPVVMHIQGIINPIYQALLPVGVSNFSLLKAENFNFLKIYKKYFRMESFMRYQAEREKNMLRSIQYFMGRTEWDRRVTEILSPTAKYFYCSEALRPHITKSRKWQYDRNRKLTIASTILPTLYKGSDVILKTAKILKEAYNGDFEWHIYGMDNLHLQEKLTGIKSKDVNVVCMGKVGSDVLSKQLLESDVFVHPSYIDNSPNSVCEAQYLGVPVVATLVGGIPSLIPDGEGMLVPANDAHQTAWSIMKLKLDEDSASDISRKEILLAEKRHDMTKITSDLMSIYKEIIDSKKNKA